MKKISKSFLDFVKPLLKEMGDPDPRTKEFESAMKLGWTVWNAVVKSDVQKDDTFIKDIELTTPTEFRPVIDVLVQRKRNKFSDMSYFIGEYGLRKKEDGSYSFYAEARDSNRGPLH